MTNFIDGKNMHHNIPNSSYKKDSLGILKAVGNLRLVGETGTGKTTLVDTLVEENDFKLYTYVLSEGTTQYDLLGSDILEGGDTKVREGVVTKWIRDESDKGKVLYLDGWNYGGSGMKSLVESLLDYREIVRIPQLEEEFERGEKHYFIVSLNPHRNSAYFGTQPENIAQKRRFKTVWLHYLAQSEEAKYLNENYSLKREECSKLASFANQTRKIYLSNVGGSINRKNGDDNNNYEIDNDFKDVGLEAPITLGDLKHFAKLLTLEGEDTPNFNMEDIPRIAANNYPRIQQETIHKCWGGNFGD